MSDGDITRFYVTPQDGPVICVGGYFDGTMLSVPLGVVTWVFQLPFDPPNIFELMQWPAWHLPVINYAVYRWTGSIQDDGTRVFRIVS